MKELKIEEPIEMSLVQYECPGCKKKFYINEEDVEESIEEIDCPFCDIAGIPSIRLFKVSVNKIFEE